MEMYIPFGVMEGVDAGGRLVTVLPPMPARIQALTSLNKQKTREMPKAGRLDVEGKCSEIVVLRRCIGQIDVPPRQ